MRQRTTCNTRATACEITSAPITDQPAFAPSDCCFPANTPRSLRQASCFPKETIIETDLTKLPWEEAYKLLISSVIPRPIAWVSTTSAQGVHNIAPFSFFNAFGAEPVILGFAPMASDDRPQKDTLANVRALGEFVINIATESTLAQMDETGRPYPPDIDEFVAAGLTHAPSVAVKPPRIAESPINFECTLFSLVPLGDGEGSSTLVLGRAVYLHIADDVLRNGKVDADLLKPVARMGGPFYARPEMLTFRRSDQTYTTEAAQRLLANPAQD